MNVLSDRYGNGGLHEVVRAGQVESLASKG